MFSYMGGVSVHVVFYISETLLFGRCHSSCSATWAFMFIVNVVFLLTFLYIGGVIVHVQLHIYIYQKHSYVQLHVSGGVIVHGSVHVVTWAYSARVIVHGLSTDSGVPYAMNHDPAPIVA